MSPFGRKANLTVTSSDLKPDRQASPQMVYGVCYYRAPAVAHFMMRSRQVVGKCKITFVLTDKFDDFWQSCQFSAFAFMISIAKSKELLEAQHEFMGSRV